MKLALSLAFILLVVVPVAFVFEVLRSLAHLVDGLVTRFHDPYKPVCVKAR